MHVGNYLGLAHKSEQELGKAFVEVAKHHMQEPDVHATCQLLGSWSTQHVAVLEPLVARYGETKSREPERPHSELFRGPRSGGLGLLRDLHDLYLMAEEVKLSLLLLDQAAMALRDKELEKACKTLQSDTERQVQWLKTRMKQAAPQALVAAD